MSSFASSGQKSKGRTFHQEREYMSRSKSSVKCYDIRKGFVDNMRVPVKFYVNDKLEGLIFDELRHYSNNKDRGGFLPAVKQMANVAALPGIVKYSIGLPVSKSLLLRNIAHCI